AAALACVAACSSLTVRPPAKPPNPPGDCTRSKTAPTVDTAVSVLYGAASLLGGALLIHSGCHGGDCGEAVGPTVLLVLPGALPALLFGWAAGYGFQQVDRCRRSLEPRAAGAAPVVERDR